MMDIFGGFFCIRSAGYLELRGIPLIVRGTSICVGYLYLYEIPLFTWGTSNCVGYLYLYEVPLFTWSTSNYVGIIPLVDTWRLIAFPIFPSNNK